MAYLIMRTAKVSGWGSVAAMGGHQARTRHTPNANPARTSGNQVLLGSGNPAADIRARIEHSGAQTKPDSVLAIEILFAASPEWWESPLADLTEFSRRAVNWARQNFGQDNLVSATVHLDESTPHVHLVAVPVDASPRQRGPQIRLNAKRWLDGRAKLSALQSSAAEAFADLGLERGIKGSRAKHTTVSKFYGELNKPLASVPDPIVQTPPPLLREKSRESWADEETDRLYASLRPAMMKIVGPAKQAQVADRKRREAVATAQAVQARAQEAEAARDRALDALRDIPLSEILEAYGWIWDRRKWLGPDGHGDISVSGSLWHHFQAGAGGHGAIDLVMHLEECDFRQAVAILARDYGPEATARAVAAGAAIAVDEAVATVKAFDRPKPAPERWPEVRRYLLEHRGLLPRIVDWFNDQGLLYADEKANLVVWNGQNCAEKRGTGPKAWKGLATGSKRAQEGSLRFWMGEKPIKRLVLVESAIDALSYAQLHGRGPYLVQSTAGAIGKTPYMAEIAARGIQLICAYDADAAGDAAAEIMATAFPGVVRERPVVGKDWNDVLQAQARQPQNPSFSTGDKGSTSMGLTSHLEAGLTEEDTRPTFY